MCFGVIGNQDRRPSSSFLPSLPSPLLAPKGILGDVWYQPTSPICQRPIKRLCACRSIFLGPRLLTSSLPYNFEALNMVILSHGGAAS